jgi:hypothetical protein
VLEVGEYRTSQPSSTVAERPLRSKMRLGCPNISKLPLELFILLLPSALSTELANDVVATLRVTIVIALQVVVRVGEIDLALVHNVDQRARSRASAAAVGAADVSGSNAREIAVAICTSSRSLTLSAAPEC